MPVVTRPSPSRVGKHQDHRVNTWDENPDRRILELVTQDCHSPYENDPRRPTPPQESGSSWLSPRPSAFKNLPLISSCFDNKDNTSTTTVAPYKNGFVDGLVRAFNQDLHLVLRPDDVWQAVISQFSLFVNGHAERLRNLFVAHEGKRVLGVDLTPSDLGDANFEKVALAFASSIQKNVVDAELRQWMLPRFSTTTEHDLAVAAFGMMGALQSYFEYQMMIGCGLPSVTLLGERSDWEELALRVERLPRYGQECARWAELLRPVMQYMLLTFDMPESQEVKDFWLRAVHEAGVEGSGQGVRTLSGWITAFAYFGEEGNPSKDFNEDDLRNASVSLYPGSPPPDVERKRLILNGVSYPLLGVRSIPRSIIVVPLLIQDLAANVKRFTTVVSGCVGVSVTADSTQVQPVSAWWVVQEFEEPLEPNY